VLNLLFRSEPFTVAIDADANADGRTKILKKLYRG
jgi:hypothetical protein